jgi:hypothetical protein
MNRICQWITGTVLAATTLPTLNAQRLTVDQLRQRLVEQMAAHKSDKEIAQKAGSIELTERLTERTVEKLKVELQLGPKTVDALVLLSDTAVSLDPPVGEFPATQAPDDESSTRMLQQAAEFAATTMHHMPDFLAVRATRSFDDSPEIVSETGWVPAHTNLHFEGTFTQPITYRDGREVTDNGNDSASTAPAPSGLSTTGEFGPVLAVVLSDSHAGRIVWRHWEQTPAGVAAVFQFQVPKETSHYAVNFCWQQFQVLSLMRMGHRFESHADVSPGASDCYNGMTAYHGTLAVDPASGAVLRISIESELPRSISLTRAAINVQYGRVEIGGRIYICPVRSVALSRVRYAATDSGPSRDLLRINETTFAEYHRFGSSSSIVSTGQPH